MQAYLKNLEKYNKMEMAKGILLDNIETEFRVGSSGISTEKFGGNWYMLPKGRAIFKDYKSIASYSEENINSNNFYDSISNMRIVNELLCQELCKQVNILCAEYELATNDGNTGLVTYDVTKPGEQLLNGYSFLSKLNKPTQKGFMEYLEMISQYEEMGYKTDVGKILKTLYKISLFDCLTAQTDRHKGNIFFLVDEEKKTIKLSPLIDNELAFNIEHFDFILRNKDKVETKDFVDNLNKIKKILFVKNVDPKNVYMSNLQEIVALAIYDEEFKELFVNTVKNFNLSKAIEKVKKQGVEISPDYENYILSCEKEIKDIIKKEVETQLNQKNEYENKGIEL